MSGYIEQCLVAHNKYRARHGSPPLVIDEKLNAYAQDWANQLSRMNVMKHRSPMKISENIWAGFGVKSTKEGYCKMAVDGWYSEVKKYVYGGTPNYLVTGHFTQVVWKSTKRLGVGVATNSRGSTFVVCNYDPWGNVQGQYPQNVFPVQKNPTPPVTKVEPKAKEVKPPAENTVAVKQEGGKSESESVKQVPHSFEKMMGDMSLQNDFTKKFMDGFNQQFTNQSGVSTQQPNNSAGTMQLLGNDAGGSWHTEVHQKVAGGSFSYGETSNFTVTKQFSQSSKTSQSFFSRTESK